MELRLLKYFLTIAEEQNITHAAEKLHIAQPPLSRQLQQLEEDLGATLFIRGKRKMELTEEGRLLKNRAEQILALVDKTEKEITEAKHGLAGTVYIGATDTISTTLLPKWVAGFKKLHPDVHYNLWSGNSEDVILRLEQGLLDFAIVREPYNHENLTGFRIEKEPWCAIIHADSPLAKLPGDQLPFCALDGIELIVPAIHSRKLEMTSWFEEAGATANIFCEFASFINAFYLVEQQVGVALLPKSVENVIHGKNLVIKEMCDPKVHSYVVILTKRYHTLSNTANKFLEYIKSLVIEEK